MNPKKSYGQNFLINDDISEKIVVSFLEKETTGNVLEIGPGKGALTRFLRLNKDIEFKAIEADERMGFHLIKNNLVTEENLIIGDFLKKPLDQIFDGQAFSIIGNFPYNISSQILFRVDKYKDLVPLVVGMFQREVAERIASKEGNKKYGVITVLLGTTFDVEILFNVKPGNFFPVPKVNSSVISMIRKADYEMPCDPVLFRSIVKMSFGQRRKMLRNSIKSLVRDMSLFDREVMTNRPEQLSIEDFYNLTTLLEHQNLS